MIGTSRCRLLLSSCNSRLNLLSVIYIHSQSGINLSYYVRYIDNECLKKKENRNCQIKPVTSLNYAICVNTAVSWMLIICHVIFRAQMSAAQWAILTFSCVCMQNSPYAPLYLGNKTQSSSMYYLCIYNQIRGAENVVKKPITAQLLKKFSFYYRTSRVNIVFWASRTQSTPSQPISLGSILILSHLHVGLPRGL
jgi:hypothetical protein